MEAESPARFGQRDQESGAEDIEMPVAAEAPERPPMKLDREMPEEQNDASAEGESVNAATSAEVPRRALKLVLTLKPSSGPGYQAVIALGAEGCDPLMRTAEVESLAAALDLGPGLAAEAESRWRLQPRYPSAPSAVPGRARAAAAANRSREVGQPPRERDAKESKAEQPAHNPESSAPSTGQLSLFG